MAEVKVSTGCLDLFLVLLQILFIALKLTHVIEWSWLLVLLPIWGIIAIYLVIIIAIVITALIM